MNFLKRVPLPLCGAALGLAALGNLLASYGMALRIFCGILSFIGILLVSCKYILLPDIFVKDMKNPVLASVSGTYTMALMLLAGYIKPSLAAAASILWYGAIAFHFLLMVYFTLNFILKLNIFQDTDLKKVFASYFIVYVGIVTASVGAPVFNNIALGQVCFWIGFVLFIPLCFYVSFRYLKLGNQAVEAKALCCIYAAPASLCAAGYINSFPEKNIKFLLFIYAAATVFYIVGVITAFRLFRHFYVFKNFRFYPSFAGLTFPFVISAIASKQLMAVLKAAEYRSVLTSVLPAVINTETVIAAAGVLFSVICFAGAVFLPKGVEVKAADS